MDSFCSHRYESSQLNDMKWNVREEPNEKRKVTKQKSATHGMKLSVSVSILRQKVAQVSVTVIRVKCTVKNEATQIR